MTGISLSFRYSSAFLNTHSQGIRENEQMNKKYSWHSNCMQIQFTNAQKKNEEDLSRIDSEIFLFTLLLLKNIAVAAMVK